MVLFFVHKYNAMPTEW